MNNLRRGFTMIELIFVVIIIGILAAIAIPKLAENRDDADAAVCVEDVGQFITEISEAYTKEGYSGFKNIKVKDITNIDSTTSQDWKSFAGKNVILDYNLSSNGSRIGGAHYLCDGDPIVNFSTNAESEEYVLTVTAVQRAPKSIAAVEALEKIKTDILDGKITKKFAL